MTWALAELDVSEVVLVGHSLGGAVAAAVAEVPRAHRIARPACAGGFGRLHVAEAISVPGIRNLTAAALPFALATR